MFNGFDLELFRFLTQLRRNNRREWFEAHRDAYESYVRQPLRAFVEEMDVRFARIAPEIIGDPRRSLFRIHRDVRFSKDKSPYKTNAAVWFYHHDAGRGVGSEAHGGAGFYLHLEPSQCFVGGGIWMPPKPALEAIRGAIADAPRKFSALVNAPAFRRRFGPLDSDALLTRVPRGYAPDHPAAEWLRYKSFTAGRELSRKEALDPKLPSKLETDVQVMLPLLRWLNGALGFPPEKRRI